MYNEAVRPCRLDVTEREREGGWEREGGRERGVMTQNFNDWKL